VEAKSVRLDQYYGTQSAAAAFGRILRGMLFARASNYFRASDIY
jgi:hypothetical protein